MTKFYHLGAKLPAKYDLGAQPKPKPSAPCNAFKTGFNCLSQLPVGNPDIVPLSPVFLQVGSIAGPP